jgi:hypothetical protein
MSWVESCNSNQENNNTPRINVWEADIKKVECQRKPDSNKIDNDALNKLEELWYLKIYTDENWQKRHYIDVWPNKKVSYGRFNENWIFNIEGQFPNSFSLDTTKSVKLHPVYKWWNMYNFTNIAWQETTIFIQDMTNTNKEKSPAEELKNIKEYLKWLKEAFWKSIDEAEKMIFSTSGLTNIEKWLQIPEIKKELSNLILDLYIKKWWKWINKETARIQAWYWRMSIYEWNNKPIKENDWTQLNSLGSGDKIPTPKEAKDRIERNAAKRNAPPNIESKTGTPEQEALNRLLKSYNIETDLLLNYDNFRKIASWWDKFSSEDKKGLTVKIVEALRIKWYQWINADKIEITFNNTNDKGMFITEKNTNSNPYWQKKEVRLSNWRFLPSKFELWKSIPQNNNFIR